MPGHYGDKEKTKTKTVTKRKNGKVVIKSKTKTKTRGGKKKAQGNNMEVGRLLKGLANSSKGNDPYSKSVPTRGTNALAYKSQWKAAEEEMRPSMRLKEKSDVIERGKKDKKAERASKRMDKKAVLSTPDRKSYDKKGRELDPETGRPKRKGTKSTLYYTKMKEGTKSGELKRANKKAYKKGEIGRGYN